MNPTTIPTPAPVQDDSLGRDAGTVSALDRGLALLDCFRGGERSLSPTELARRTGIPRPTVTRLAATLRARQWLQSEPDGEGYRLGPGIVALARDYLSALDVRAAAHTPMQGLADLTGGSVYLALRDGLHMVIVEACRARSTMLTARLDVGSRVPLPNSALGRAWLAACGDTARSAVETELATLHGKDWPNFKKGLDASLLQGAKKDGVYRSVGEFHREINSVSVAMHAHDGTIYAFNCGGPAFAFVKSRLQSVVAPALLEMAYRVAHATGGLVFVPVVPKVSRRPRIASA